VDDLTCLAVGMVLGGLCVLAGVLVYLWLGNHDKE
jgi:hypothetical protein